MRKDSLAAPPNSRERGEPLPSSRQDSIAVAAQVCSAFESRSAFLVFYHMMHQ